MREPDHLALDAAAVTTDVQRLQGARGAAAAFPQPARNPARNSRLRCSREPYVEGSEACLIMTLIVQTDRPGDGR